jgi:hypothetical protein
MNIPQGEFWFEGGVGSLQALIIQQALEEAGIIHNDVVTEMAGMNVYFRVITRDFVYKAVRQVIWGWQCHLSEEIKKLPKVVFNPQISLDISVEMPEWESPQMGSRWEGGLGGGYILAAVEEQGVALISLERGSRYQDIVSVKCVDNISKAEWEAISRGGKFTPKV